MEDLLSVDRLLAVWNAVFGWLRTNVFVLDTAIQAGVIALTLLLAVLLSNRVKVWLARYREHRHVGRGVVILESLAFAITWFGRLDTPPGGVCSSKLGSASCTGAGGAT